MREQFKKKVRSILGWYIIKKKKKQKKIVGDQG